MKRRTRPVTAACIFGPGCKYSRRRGMSFNALIREHLHKPVYRQAEWTEETFRAMDDASGGSGGRKWRRGDLYDVRIK